MTTTIYTDGACSNGLGGWGWWCTDTFWGSGAVRDSTNNQMELLAVIKAIERVQTHSMTEDLLIVSDSAYVVNCFADGWYRKWRRNGWVNSSKKPVLNREMWEQLLDLYERHEGRITFRHIRGHGKGGVGDHPYVAGNDKADRLAVAARKTLER